MLSVYACVAGFGGLSIFIGQSVRRLAGGQGWTWTAPAVGLGTAICVGEVGVRLPGHGWTVLGILVVLAAAGAVTSWPEMRRHPRALAPGLVVGVLVTAAVSLPFLLNGRLGLLGAHVLDDLGFHLAWAEALSTGHGGFSLIDRIQPGYPVGPHTVVASLAPAFGVLPAFTGFLMVVPVLTALTALGALRAVPTGWRVAGAVLTGLPYLAVSYFAEGSFKEPTAALLVLGFVLVLSELPARPRPRAALPLAVLALACALTFGLRGLVWPVAALAAWALVAAVPRRRRLLSSLRRLAPGILVLAGGLVLAAALGASLWSAVTDVASYGDTSLAGGNFIQSVSPFVGLGGWPIPDFRLSPESTAKVVLATAVVVVALVYALALAARRRDPLLFAATGAMVVVYIVAAAASSSYLSLKALVVVAQLLTLSIARALFLLDPRWRRAQLATALAFAAVIAWSSTTALRGASVSVPAHADQLLAQRSLLRHGPTLVLFDDRYVRWELLGVRLGNPLAYGFAPDVPIVLRGGKSPSTLDFDSLPSGVLDRFRYAVTVRGPYASQPPANWRLRRQLPSFDIWERHGPTPPRETLDEQDRPGAVLACAARRRGLRGVAAVRPFPVLGPVSAWRIPGAAPPSGGGGPAPLPPGREMSQTLDLPPGTWSISLRYSSWVPLSLRAGSLHVRLPAITEPPVQFRLAGAVRSPGGPVRVSVRAEHGGWGLIARDAEVDTVAATPVPWSERLVSLSRACGAYVDWFAR